MCAAAFGVNDPLRNALSVEVGDEVNQVEVLKEEGAVGTGTLCLVWMGYWDTVAGSIEGLLAGSVAVILVCPKLSSKCFAVSLTVARCLCCHVCCRLIDLFFFKLEYVDVKSVCFGGRKEWKNGRRERK